MELNLKLKTIGKLEDGPAIIAEGKRQALVVGGELFATAIKELTPVNTGRLRASVGFKLKTADRGILGTPKVYASVMELGRRPGKFPPPEPMRLWVRRQLRIRDPKEIKAVAFLVSRKIARVGIKGRKMFEKGIRAARGVAFRQMGQILDRYLSQRLSG